MKSCKKTVSVIIPVFNTEDFLSECIESIIGQTYKELQIIIINDGSTDNSKKIIENYSKIDKRIITITTNNNGLSAARNIGLNLATGDYILFVDSDDIINEKLIEICIGFAKTSDIVRFEAKTFTNSKTIDKSIQFISVTEKNNIEITKELLVDKLGNQTCFGFYKMSLWKNIYFPNGRYFEDLSTTYKVYCLNNKPVKLINNGLYYYRVNPKSISHNPDAKKIYDQFLAFKEHFDICTNLKYDDEANFCLSLAAKTAIAAINKTITEKNKLDISIALNFIKKYRRNIKASKYLSSSRKAQIILFLRSKHIYICLLKISHLIKR